MSPVVLNLFHINRGQLELPAMAKVRSRSFTDGAGEGEVFVDTLLLPAGGAPHGGRLNGEVDGEDGPASSDLGGRVDDPRQQ